jgi:chromosome segregation protein
MKLTRLELSGFKSFADTVTLNFEEGVTAIVGPNGCGKSNVSDAVRWVLGEQSARLLRGGTMEDVIFQGSTHRRPVNVSEVSLYLDNSDGSLPVAYQEVVVTRRLSRSGQSEYLLNRTPSRLRDIQDLLRGTGMGSDAGVVIEARMIDLLLSDRADERRSLFEEAAGIGLYRDRKHSTERRLEETQADLQRLEDLIAEVQSQIRSLARQKGKAERHARLTEEKFAVQLTLATTLLADLEREVAGMQARHAELAAELPALRAAIAEQAAARDERARQRTQTEQERTRRMQAVSEVQVAMGRLEGDIGVATEKLASALARRARAGEERVHSEMRSQQARAELEDATGDAAAAEAELGRIREELAARSEAEDGARRRLSGHRTTVRDMEEELQRQAQQLRSLEGERAALESELASLREAQAQEQAHLAQLHDELQAASARQAELGATADRIIRAAQAAAAAADSSRHLVAELREHEAAERAERRRVDETLAQLHARRQALEELERDRVGLAPGAAALIAARARFGDAVLGPLSDYLSTDRSDAELAERLLGEWMHAVLVRDLGAVQRIQAWHLESGSGTLVLLPASPGPAVPAHQHPLEHRLRADEVAAPWVRALLGGSEVLDHDGRSFRRASGAIVLSAKASTSGPLQRRAELAQLVQDAAAQERTREEILARLDATTARLAAVEREAEESAAALLQAREAERHAVAAREDAARLMTNLERERGEAATRLSRTVERLARATDRLSEVDTGLREGEVTRARLEESLGSARAELATIEAEVEGTREARVHWQVQAAHAEARLRAATERITRAEQVIAESGEASRELGDELSRLDRDTGVLRDQLAHWQEARAERQATLAEMQASAAQAESALQQASEALEQAETALAHRRAEQERRNEEYHRLELALAEAAANRRRITDRIEAEWRAPLDTLLEGADLLDLDRETLEAESARLIAALEAIGPVNPLAVEEHAEESKRLEFLTTQRDDLVAARQSLLQAIREIDGTARAMFMETFEAIRSHFVTVFRTLFGGGECELRLSDPEDPLEAEIEIHAAPRGKRTQRIHLLSSGERTLVATSLLFAIYLTKPSPFCLMDEVDAPLDDSNVGRFTTLLDEFKDRTQFVVITHNPRTMQAADSVYGVTMQEPGVSTIVGVRLGESHAA